MIRKGETHLSRDATVGKCEWIRMMWMGVQRWIMEKPENRFSSSSPGCTIKV